MEEMHPFRGLVEKQKLSQTLSIYLLPSINPEKVQVLYFDFKICILLNWDY
jgi:hypothetical protein